MEPYVGMICIFGFDYAPDGWLQCNGQAVAINQYSALYALLGTRYGGDGRTTFGLPDLRGRVPAGWDTNGTIYGTYFDVLGEKGGSLEQDVPLLAHAHAAALSGTGTISGTVTAKMNVSTSEGAETSPDNKFLGLEGSGGGTYATSATSGKTLNADAITVNTSGLTLSGYPVTIQPTGTTSTQILVLQPYQVLNYCIAITGIFPSRP
jgi:microcystin-dependent protein